jgi:hypothetical protein
LIALLVALALVAGGASDQTPGQALIRLARSLSDAGFVPARHAIRHIIHRDLFGTFQPAAAQPAGFDRWTSNDRSCFAEVIAIEPRRPLARIMFGCRFTASVDAERFLREVAAAFGRPLVPLLPETMTPDYHHRAVIVVGVRLIGVELHAIPDGSFFLASVVVTEGRRIVITGGRGGASTSTSSPWRPAEGR